MPLRNTKESYGKLTIAIHWLMAMMVIGVIFVGFFMVSLEKGPDKLQIIQIHKASGFLILMLALFRWYWMLTSEKLQALPGMANRDIAISHAFKWALMLMLLAQPVSGWLMSMAAGHGIDFYGLFEIPVWIEKNKAISSFFHKIHEIGAFVISGIVVLHILAALRHHFIVKDDTLNRMLGRK